MMERDPVCHMDLRPGQEEASFTYQDKTYHFCSTECCKMFQADPKRYIKEMEEAAQQR
jgi:YHS domain-containing protein